LPCVAHLVPGRAYNADMFRTPAAIFVAASLAVVTFARGEAQPSFDLIVRNGRVLDGSGNPWLRQDIGIREGRIVAVGRLEGAAAQVIDAADRIVAPGFIDVHSHAAEGLTREELRQGRPLLAQGVTTIVANPDGGGAIDLARQRSELEAGGTGPNVALLVGHGRIRGSIVGSADRDPTADELDRMRD